jgi:3,4-dihydroxy 2-butanone 4-phosphate synthase / GTP cyclohydrolase II
MTGGIATIEQVIDDFKAGRMVVLVDDEDRENEGDLLLAAERTTPEAINFMAKHGRGLICLTLTEKRCERLNLPLMVSDNRAPLGTNFTVSIEAAAGVTTGISAHDRARTVLAAVAPDAAPSDLVQPGHIFPLKARDGGVLIRAGHTEAGCDLAALAGMEPAAVICEILNDDGTMARLPDLLEFSRRHGIKVGTIADLIRYRSEHDRLIEREAERDVSTPFGGFRAIGYYDAIGRQSHLALVKGPVVASRETLVRVHEPFNAFDFLDEKSQGHSFGIRRAMEIVGRADSGVIVLLRRPEGPRDLVDWLKAADGERRLRDKWDARLFGVGAQILRDVGVGRMRLLASPRRIPSMAGFGLEITGYVAPDETH